MTRGPFLWFNLFLVVNPGHYCAVRWEIRAVVHFKTSYRPFRNGKDRTWNGVERWNTFWNAFRNVWTLLEHFLERVPERFWHVPGTRSRYASIYSLSFGFWNIFWNAFRNAFDTYLERVPGTQACTPSLSANILERFWIKSKLTWIFWQILEPFWMSFRVFGYKFPKFTYYGSITYLPIYDTYLCRIDLP